MKGIIFTEFLEMVETEYGMDMVDRLIDSSKIASQGAYTSVGTYDHRELIHLVGELSSATSIPAGTLTRQFGIHLFQRLATAYPGLFQGIPSARAFLAKVEDHIHVEVRKLYPDAELPRVLYREVGPDEWEILYSSSRPFGDLAEGLVLGCVRHFKTPIQVRREDFPPKDGLTSVRFTMTSSEESA